jgi:hypothetical protein
MKVVFAGLLLMTLVAFTGCNQGTPGGPGATDPNTKKPVYGQADDTFNLSVPLLATAVKQGETKAVSIGIKRGKNFDEDVTLQFADLPKGITLDPTRPRIKHGDAEAKLMLSTATQPRWGTSRSR